MTSSSIKAPSARVSALGEVACFVRGITFKPEDLVPVKTPGCVVCMRTKNVQQDLDESDLIALPAEFVRRQEQYLREGDLLVSSANSWNLVGKCSWVPRLPYSSTAGGFISILRADPARVLPRYLYYWFSWDRTQALVRACGRQTTNISNLDFSRCLALELPVPSLKEQQRIAAILDKANAICRKRGQTEDLSRDIVDSAFADLFGETWSNPREWPMGILQDLCGSIVDCPHSTPIYSDVPTGLYCVRSSDIQDGNIDFGSTLQVAPDVFEERIRRYKPQRGDVIYTREGGRLGNAAQVPPEKEVCLGQRMMLFSEILGESTNEFIWALLNSAGVRKQVEYLTGGAAAPRINIADIRLFKVVKPPFEIQRSFSQIVNKHREREARLSESSSCLKELFDSLMSRAFRGEL